MTTPERPWFLKRNPPKIKDGAKKVSEDDLSSGTVEISTEIPQCLIKIVKKG